MNDTSVTQNEVNDFVELQQYQKEARDLPVDSPRGQLLRQVLGRGERNVQTIRLLLARSEEMKQRGELPEGELEE